MREIRVTINTTTPEKKAEATLVIPAKQVLDLEGITVVLIEALNDNVLGLDKSGKLLWQIEDAALIYDQKTKLSYTSISESNLGQIRAHSYIGIDYVVDVETGKVVDRDTHGGRPW